MAEQSTPTREMPPPSEESSLTSEDSSLTSEDSSLNFEESPPAYEESPPAYETFWQRGPATSGEWYLVDPQPETMVFIFDSDLLERDERQDWLARLMVKCGDVPRLMREGFHWDSGNLVHEDGYIMYRRLDEDNSGNTRFYFLKDRQYPPRWTASLEVHASCVETLYRFDLDQLSREIIFFAAATSQAGDSIYQYYHHSPAYSFNAIYDDMPMEGKWPLPRNYSEDQV